MPTGKTLWTSLPGERPPGLNRLAQRDLRALCFQPGSTALDVALEIGEVVRLDALTGKEQRRFLADWRSPEERRSPRSQWPWMWKAAFSSDGRVLATSADEFVYVWDVSAGKLRWSTRRPHQHCCTLALSPDGKALAAVDVAPYHGDWGKDAIRLYDTRSGEQFLTLDPAGDRVTTLAFSPDGARLFTAFYRTAALVWDVRRKPGSIPPTKSREP
ncbi:MAG: WD40 repeat domain-containing protein [Isosphaeraceae bacterium]